MKKPKPTKKLLAISLIVLLILILVGVGAYSKRDSIKRRWYGYQVRHELSQQLKPLDEPLAKLGFTNLSAPKVTCATLPKTSYNDTESSCTATISKYAVINGKQMTDQHYAAAVLMSQRLSNSSWSQRRDLPTIPWFKNIAKGVDYQPDQLNIKQLKGTTCTVDFYTAFSKPAPPAVNMVAMCYKPGFSIASNEKIN